MDWFVSMFTQKLVLLTTIYLSAVGSFFATAHNNTALQTAMAVNTIAPVFATMPDSTDFTPTVSHIHITDVTPGLLPTVPSFFCTSVSPCGVKGLRALIAKYNKFPPQLAKVATAGSASMPVPAAPQPPVVMAADAFLKNTTVALKPQRNGSYEISLTTTDNGSVVLWDLSESKIGGTASAPWYSQTFLCTPTPDAQNPGSPDQNPLFEPKTSYDCTVSLTPLFGNDMRTQSHDFTFTTGAGQLFVTPATAMNTVLSNETNQGGIVFDNKDTSAITITSLTFDASYSGINAVGQPLVFRILDPTTNQSIFDYHLESGAPAASMTATISKTNIVAPLSFLIAGAHERMLPIEILGVQRVLVPGDAPSITITLKNVTTNRNDVATNLGAAIITWTCTIPMVGANFNSLSVGATCTN